MTTQTTRDTIAHAVALYTQAGGTITHCAQGARALQYAIDPALVGCTCGCKGNYTDHTMREFETGRFHY